MNNNKKIPTLIGVLVLVFGLAGGVVLVNKDTIFKLGASPDTTPKDVRITNVTEGSFTVNWVTDKQTTGIVKWGETSNLGQTVTPDGGPTKTSYTHSTTVRNLTKNKTYYFSINSAGVDVTNNGIPWNTTTISSTSSDVSHASGTILLPTGVPASDAIVYIDAPGMTEQSTVTSSSGNWILALPLPESAKDTLLTIDVRAGTAGVATAQVYLGSSNPVPSITLGKTYDFRSSTQTGDTSNVPQTSVVLPNTNTTTEQKSRFSTTTSATPQPATSTVTVKSVDNGETIYTTTPEFFGEGPKNTSITVTVHSTTAITQNVTVASDGSWKWSPPTNLEEGSHTLTVSWKNAQGVLQTITKTFTVVANAQEPAFVSTPSATVKPTTTPKATATPTIAPTVAPTLTPTIAPTVKPTKTATPSATPVKTASPSALPVAGSPFATIAFISTGLALILGAVYLNISLKK